MTDVYIDSREKGSAEEVSSRAVRANEYFKTLDGVDRTFIVQLRYGDYLFVRGDTSVVFEYKTIDDYMNSLYDKSLFEETYNQTVEYDYSYVIIEGDLNDYVRRNNYLLCDVSELTKTFNGSLCRLRVYCNVIMVKNEREAFKIMFKQAEKCFNFKAYGGAKRSLPTNDIVSYTLSGCHGVSHRLIENIQKQLPHVVDLECLLECDVEDFKSVDGIGEKKHMLYMSGYMDEMYLDNKKKLQEIKYMVIDKKKCISCGKCIFACENCNYYKDGIYPCVESCPVNGISYGESSGSKIPILNCNVGVRGV